MIKIPKRKTWLLSLMIATLHNPLSGQNPIYLSIDKAVEISAKNNAINQKAELDKRIAKANRHQTDAIFLPQISLGYNALYTNDPLNAFGFLLQQRRVAATDFEPNNLNRPGNSHNYVASVDFQMPLLNMDKIYARKGAKLQEEIFDYQAEFTADKVKFEVQKAYTQLQFAYQMKEILSSTLSDVKGIYDAVDNFYHQGLLQKSDVLNAKVQVNTIEAALSKAESNIKNASDGLRVFLGENLSVSTETYQTDPLKPIVYSAANKNFTTQRSDIMAMKKAVDAAKIQTKSAAMAFVPSINAFGSYQFNDDQCFHFQEDSYLVGISLRWNLFSGNMNRSKYKSASFQRQKMQKDYDLYLNKSRMEVDMNLRAIADLNLEIQKQETSVKQAHEALRITSNRHKEGLVSTTDLLLAQAQYSKQKLALAQAIMNYNIACYFQNILTQPL